MRRLKAIGSDLGTDHGLAADLWSTGVYEARTIAAFIDDPALVTTAQMDRWCHDADSWAIVDTVCFHLFDRAPDRWSRVPAWAPEEELYVRRSAFALLWALALHDRAAPDERFMAALDLIAAAADDDRPHVTKALTMALRAIIQKRPHVAPAALSLARDLDSADGGPRRKVGRPIVRDFDTS